MTKVLVFGASGMLGHQLIRGLSADFEVVGTVRGDPKGYQSLPHFKNALLVGGVDAYNSDAISSIIEGNSPDVVINAVGMIKQISGGNSAVPAIRINALLPHLLANCARSIGARFITFGTDCVFSGLAGPYKESDVPDARDVYGRSKLLGEVNEPGCLTIRTSIVGRELRGRHSLIEWFVAQSGKTVKGYKNALYTGMTTGAACQVVKELILKHPELCGVWQVAGPQISKFELLGIVRDALSLDIEIQPDCEFYCDRRLDGSRFTQATGIFVPEWRQMIRKMASESELYSLPDNS